MTEKSIPWLLYLRKWHGFLDLSTLLDFCELTTVTNVLCSMVKYSMCPSSEGNFWRPFGPKVFRPKFSDQNIIIIWFWKGDRSQTLLGKWECHCLPFIEEKIQELSSPSPTLQWTLENSHLWRLLLRLNGNQRVLLTSWLIVPRSVPYLTLDKLHRCRHGGQAYIWCAAWKQMILDPGYFLFFCHAASI